MFWIKKQKNIIHNHAIIGRVSPVDKIIKPKSKPLRIILALLGLILFAVIFWIGINAYSAIGKIVTKNQSGSAPFLGFLGSLDANQLKGEGDGRVNILLLGIGGVNHPGGQLADTIMVISADPQNKKIALLSIPRDLYVQIEGNGYGKINYAHAYGEQNAQKTGGGPIVMKKTVANILDLPIHYYIRGDFDGLVKLVDTLGGITVDVQKTINDPFYPDKYMVGYEPFYLQAGRQNLDGKTALKFARSRETTSDFDRSSRQQQLLIAIKDKSLSAGVLSNPKKITEILKILGDHIRTDLGLWEMEKLFSIFKDTDTAKIVLKVLDNSPEGPLVSSSGEQGYYLVPKTGNYKQIQRIAHEIFSEPYLLKENTRIEVLNASGQSGQAKEVQDTLISYGYNVVKIDKYPEDIAKTVIYDYTGGQKPFTLEFLKKRFHATVKNQPKTQNNVDLTLILGKDYVE